MRDRSSSVFPEIIHQMGKRHVALGSIAATGFLLCSFGFGFFSISQPPVLEEWEEVAGSDGIGSFRGKVFGQRGLADGTAMTTAPVDVDGWRIQDQVMAGFNLTRWERGLRVRNGELFRYLIAIAFSFDSW